MKTAMAYSMSTPNPLHHQNGITANFIHSLDALHLREIIKGVYMNNISVFPIHDSVIIDLDKIRGVKRIVSQSFNEIYANPEEILKSF